MNVDIIELNDDKKYEYILKLLKESHESNIEKGLIYATSNLELSDLISRAKVHDGITYNAFVNDQLAGSVTVSFRTLNYWYHNGSVSTIKLLAVSPKFKGMGIASLLIDECIKVSKIRGINVIVSDTAEENKIMEKIFIKKDFHMTDYCKYPANNFNSVVYVKWLGICPYSNEEIDNKFKERKKSVLEEYN